MASDGTMNADSSVVANGASLAISTGDPNKIVNPISTAVGRSAAIKQSHGTADATSPANAIGSSLTFGIGTATAESAAALAKGSAKFPARTCHHSMLRS